MDKVILKIKQLEKQGHTIFSFNEKEIWYTDKVTGKLKNIYLTNKTKKHETF